LFPNASQFVKRLDVSCTCGVPARLREAKQKLTVGNQATLAELPLQIGTLQ
jgi:hypothetical protein